MFCKHGKYNLHAYNDRLIFFQYVLKKMNLQNASKRERKAAEQEAKLLAKLKHPNIVSYKDSFETEDGFLYIGMGYCEGGDLYSRLKEQKGTPLEERQVVEWFVQIAMALQVRLLASTSRYIHVVCISEKIPKYKLLVQVEMSSTNV